MLAGPLLTRFAIWPWWMGFLSCAAGSLCGLFLLLRLPWRRHKKSALFGALPLLPLLWFLTKAISAPPHNDISTDPQDPPALIWAKQLRSRQDLPVSEGPLKGLADNPGPLYTSALPEEVIGSAERLMQAKGWRTIRPPDGLQAVATSPWFGFEDDIALRLRIGREVRVDLRSASRVGRSDLGVNRERVVDFMQELARELAKEAPAAATTRH